MLDFIHQILFILLSNPPTSIWVSGLIKRGGGIGVPSFWPARKEKRGWERGGYGWTRARFTSLSIALPHTTKHYTRSSRERDRLVAGPTTFLCFLWLSELCQRGRRSPSGHGGPGDTLTLRRSTDFWDISSLFFPFRSVDPVARSSCFPRPGIMLLTKGCSLDDELKRGLRVSQNSPLFPQRKHLLKDRDSGKGRPVLLVSHDDYTHQAKCFEHLSRIVWVIRLALCCFATCYDYNYWAHGVFVRMGVVGSIFFGRASKIRRRHVGGWVEADLDTRLVGTY
ncbi:hypothetical protein K456DRAFT_87515 [Colletotrichum gloeosporioides 23]|nr:hypothetical protein K456DRAFT_87515 [Colletotrichum gloeosporioides 23]